MSSPPTSAVWGMQVVPPLYPSWHSPHNPPRPPYSTLYPTGEDEGGGGKSGRTLACLMNVTFCDGKSRKCARRWCW
jgi:hypothetical protein